GSRGGFSRAGCGLPSGFVEEASGRVNARPGGRADTSLGGRTPPWWEESQPPGCPTAQQQQATPRERRHSTTTAFTRAGCVPHRGWLEQMATGTWRRTRRKPGPDNEKQLNVVVGDTGIETVTSSV